MPISNKIRATSLDFDDIKASLIEFLQGQSEFTDFSFTGSAMNMLVELLAYNTHFNALYANMAVNEMFLDTATKRANVVSHAKNLGYVPSSSMGAVGVVDIVVSNPSGNPSSLLLPENSAFLTSIDGVSYNFYNQDAIIISPVDGVFKFSNVSIKEGTPLRNKFFVSDGARYIIPNSNVDMGTVKVKVQQSSSSSVFIPYLISTDFTQVDSTSNVFFVKEIENELYEVYFGDGIVGNAPENGNVVIIDYFVTNKAAANGAKRFSFSGDIGGGNVAITTISPATGGTEIESIESIKFNAPISYTAANRAVTVDDYKAILPKLYSNIESINVWGGEDNDPPIYGKVFIAIKPKSGEVLTTSTKEAIKSDLLRSKNVVSIIPEIVDPEYVYLLINSTVYYNNKETTKSTETLKSLVKQTINDYNDNFLQKFDGIFRHSKLSKLIDEADASILSNITTLNMRKKLVVTIGQMKTYTVNFSNPIWESGAPQNAILSSGFTIQGNSNTVYFNDDGQGIIKLFFIQSAGTKSYIKNVGTVDYASGLITITDLFVLSAANSTITVDVVPDSNDVVSVRKQLVLINPVDVTTNAIIDTIATGESSGGTDYIHTPSR